MKKTLTGFVPFMIDTPNFQPIDMKVVFEFDYRFELFYIVPKYDFDQTHEEYFIRPGEFNVFHINGIKMCDEDFTGSPEKIQKEAVKIMGKISESKFDEQIKKTYEKSNQRIWRDFQETIKAIEL
jgi:hypothetical protein